jgi:hypothetical protein
LYVAYTETTKCLNDIVMIGYEFQVPHLCGDTHDHFYAKICTTKCYIHACIFHFFLKLMAFLDF